MSIIPPFFVNLSEFETKLVIIYLNLLGSEAILIGIIGSYLTLSVISF